MDEVTLHRMTEGQLREEVEYYRNRRLLLDSIDRIARVGYYEWCPEQNRLLSCSEEYARIFKMSVDDILAAETDWESVLAEIHPEDRERYRACFSLPQHDEHVEIEYRILRRDKAVRHVREISVLEPDPATGKSRNYGILQDITGLHGDPDALNYREALAHEVEAITAIGHFIYSEHLGVYKYVSPGLARIFGQSPGQFLASVRNDEDDISDIHPEDLDRVREVYDRYDASGETYSVEYRIFRDDGEMRWVRERCVTYSVKNGVILESLGVLQDITEQKRGEAELLLARAELESIVARLEEQIAERQKIEKELEFLANHDALTSLPSLRLGLDRLEQAIRQARRNHGNVFVLFIDLDSFKQVNDNHGHHHGDAVLKKSAERIQKNLRDADTAARIGGDEFLVVLAGTGDPQHAAGVANKLNSALARVAHHGDTKLKITASIGIAAFPDDGDDAETLIRLADTAMYRVKQAGKNGYGFYGKAVAPKLPGRRTH